MNHTHDSKKMWKKIILVIVISAFIAAGGIYWYSYTRELRIPVSDAINAIPSNASIIFESRQSKNTWKKLSETSLMWKEMLGTAAFSKLDIQARYIDSLLKLNPAVSQLLDNRSLFISAHVSGAATFDFLFIYSLPDLRHQPSVEEFIKMVNNNSEPAHRNYGGEDIRTIHPQNKDSLSFAFLNGILMMSGKQNLVEDAIRQIKSGISLANDKNFSKVINTAGKNVDANVYVNYKNLPGILNNFISPNLKKDINSLADFADFSGWDIAIKPNALMLGGFTQANDSAANFLNLFSRQKPQGIELTRVIPSKTALLLFFGISNMKGFQHDYKNYLSAILQGRRQNYEQYMEEINSKYRINIERSMIDWMSSEIALVITEASSSDLTNNSYAVIHSNNIDDAVSTLNALSDTVNIRNKKRASLKSYRNHAVNCLNLPRLLPELLGWQFSRITNNYFTAAGDYIVFANSEEAIQNFINDFENNKTLAGDKNYKTFSENISSEANVYIYSSIARSPNIYSAFTDEPSAKNIENSLELFHKFEGIGIQFTANNKLFYSSVYLKFNPKYNLEGGTLWETKLDTSVSSKPCLVINHLTKTKETAVQDDADKLYLIGSTGKIIWTKQLPEKIISDVQQVDILKNGKLQMLFNTRSAIYMLDRNGKDVKGFPIELKSNAANAISVFDYEKNHDYRIFAACENKKIYCFKPTGEEVKNFKFDKTNSVVKLPIQYFSVDDKDYLCAVDVKGKIYIFNRQGETRIKVKEDLGSCIRNFYIETGKNLNSTIIIAADTLGKIAKVNLGGGKESFTIKDFETAAFFDYQDINNDKNKEYIFLCNKELQVFSQDKALLFKYEFNEPIKQAPLFFTFPDSTQKIGVVSEASNELYLINADGSLYKGFPLQGKTLFTIGDMNNEGRYNLITGSSDNSIYNYQLE